MNSFWSKGPTDATSISGAPPGSFDAPSYEGGNTQASNASGTPKEWPGEAAQQAAMDQERLRPVSNTLGYPGRQQQPTSPSHQYPGQPELRDGPPQYYDGASSAFTQYTGLGGDPSLLAPSSQPAHSLNRADTTASVATQNTAGASLSGLSQPDAPTGNAVWKLGRLDPVLPDYRGIPVVPGTTTYQPGTANGAEWHERWKLQITDDEDKKFVDTWKQLTAQCSCGFGKHLPVQINLCPESSVTHINNARDGIRILKQQYFNNSEKVTVAAWDKVLDTGDTFGKSVRYAYSSNFIRSRTSLASSL